MCGLYNYKFVPTKMNWEDARSHCKSQNTDLATLPLQINLRKISSTGSSHWIGLQRYPNENRMWHWSRPDLDFVETEAKWGAGEPNNMFPPENCVYVENKVWVDHRCSCKFPFFCYDGKNNCHYATSSSLIMCAEE